MLNTSLPHPLDPRIGVQMRNGSYTFYAFHQGYEFDPIEGDLNQVETALGLSPTPLPRSSHVALVPAGKRCKTVGLRSYVVTVTPTVTLYCGSNTIGESVEYVEASSRRDAERQVRQMLREINGRYMPKYTVTATLADR